MIARLQKLLTFGVLALSMLWVYAFRELGYFAVALAGGLFAITSYAVVLGAEFILLRSVHGDDAVPRARLTQLLRAWWNEILTAPKVFCWRQPFCSGRWPNHLPHHAQGSRGVLLIHGFVCNRGMWNPWLKRLASHGTPVIAMNLEPVFGTIDAYVAQIDTALQQIERCTGQPPVIVAHSMGGLALRRWWAVSDRTGRVHHAITIATPHQGTWLARFGMTPNSRQMRCDSKWLSELAASEPADRARHFTCFYSNCDNIVFPPANATLAGADNRCLSGVSHLHMVCRPEPWDELQRWLRQPPFPAIKG